MRALSACCRLCRRKRYPQRPRSASRQALPILRFFFREFDGFHSFHEREKDHLHIEPRKVVAKAQVGALSKSDVPIGLPGDIEAIGGRELYRVPVGRAVKQAELAAFRVSSAHDLYFFRGVAVKIRQWRFKPEHFLHGSVYVFRMFP